MLRENVTMKQKLFLFGHYLDKKSKEIFLLITLTYDKHKRKKT